MWNTSNSNGYNISDGGLTLISTKSSCMSPTLPIQYYKDDTLTFENSNSFYNYNVNASHQNNNLTSKSSTLVEITPTNMLSNEQLAASNKEMLDLIYNRVNNHQQEFASMSSVANNSEFNSTNNDTESNYGLEFNSSYIGEAITNNNGVVYHHLSPEQQQQNNACTTVTRTNDTILNSSDISGVDNRNATENMNVTSISNCYSNDSFGKIQNYYEGNNNISNNNNSNMQHQEEYQTNSTWSNHDHLNSISINGYSYSPYSCANSCFNSKPSENNLSMNGNLEQTMSIMEKSSSKKHFNKSYSNRSVNNFVITNEASTKSQANANPTNSNMFGDSSSSSSSLNSSGVFCLSKSSSKKNFSGNSN
jgi:hypothetical protein